MELRELLTQVFTGSLSAQIELISTFQDFGYNIKLIKIEEEKKMLNVDKYRKEIDDYITIEKYLGDIDCKIATLRGIRNCSEFECEACMKESLRWLFQEYEPPLLENGDGLKPGDWNMVKNMNDAEWNKRQFAYYYKGNFHCDSSGWSLSRCEIDRWEQARLPEDGE